ncbi:S-adenosylmethionine mitochondrial carrier protein, partial [Fusarium oxysporum f. sp. raphani]
MSANPPTFQSALLAGALAGTTVDLSLSLDTLKTRLQSSAGFFPSGGFTVFIVGFLADKDNTSAPGWKAPLTHMAAASAGEVAACAVRVPTEVVKQRAQAGHHGGSSAAALRAILSRYSSHGFVPMWRELYRVGNHRLPRGAIYCDPVPAMGGYEVLGTTRRGGREVTGAESALYGSMAGGLSAALTTPLDVLKRESCYRRRV